MRTVTPPKEARLIPAHAERVFKGIMYDVYHWQQPMYDGSLATFEMLKRLDTMKVMAVKDDKIIFIKDEQPAHKMKYALPGGRHDIEGETELECAKRELKEETGLTFKTWKLIDIHQPFEEIEWFVYFFLASGLESESESHIDVGEKIELSPMTIQQALQVVPQVRTMNRVLDILKRAGSIEGLLALPEYRAS